MVDHTGLAGEYDIKLDFALLVRNPGGPTTPVDTVNGRSLAMALWEQLGLKLDPVRTPVEILGVDGAENPGEN